MDQIRVADHVHAGQLAQQVTIRERIDAFARRSPAQLAMTVFALIILFITSLLLIPIAKAGPGGAGFVDALFTATSAVCVTGLTVVDSATYWTPFGQTVMALGAQIGGLGVMTIASILGLAVSRHIGLTQKILAATETKSRLGEVGSLLKAVVITSAIAEGILVLLFLPVLVDHGMPFLQALGHSLFMAVSTFNNAGFVILDGGLMPFVGHWGMGIPIMLGTIAGAIGFPVTLNVARNWRQPREWSLHTKLTLVTYFSLLGIAMIGVGALEWNNALAGMSLNEKIMNAMVHGTTPRSSGISIIDIGAMHESTWFFMDTLMFVGSGSASTGGGIKVSTFAVLMLAIIAEARGDRDTEAFGRRIPPGVIRLAISAAFLGAFLVGIATLTILHISDFPLSRVIFDVISAFATVGLSTGITPDLPDSAQLVLVVLMYLGRVGTMTMAAALALRHRSRVIRYPEERPIIG